MYVTNISRFICTYTNKNITKNSILSIDRPGHKKFGGFKTIEGMCIVMIGCVCKKFYILYRLHHDIIIFGIWSNDWIFIFQTPKNIGYLDYCGWYTHIIFCASGIGFYNGI